MSRLFALLAVCILSQSVMAEYYERDNNYAYKVTPYSEIFASVEGVKFTAAMSGVALEKVLANMVENKMLPQAVLSYEDLAKFSRVHNEIDNLVSHLNDFVKEQRDKQGTYFSKTDLLPDAIMVFGGGKISFNIGKGIGASGSLGLVVMPVNVEKFSLTTGKLVDNYYSIRTAMVAIPSVDAGLGAGGGSRFRVGLSAIWDINHSFIQPEQFWGGGLAVSWDPPKLGIGLNTKAGVIGNWESPQRNFFVMGSAAIEFGAVAEAHLTPRINVTSVVNGVTFLNMFNTSAEKAYKEQMRDLSKQMDEMIRRIGPEVRDRHTDNDVDQDEEPTKPGKPVEPGTKQRKP